ncbi:HNH endonuclease signature motif containing protein [Peribacillus frigoritolerans]|uniref:HNH endonuclease signature motif containing protein n=1 Tax=Peribacillus frigoritolerans TaxID=450367 RepID=UPI001071458C|nr:HNH endonuclease [Peribacillus frigoritolerans]
MNDAGGACQDSGEEYEYLVHLRLVGENSLDNLLVLCPNCHCKLAQSRKSNNLTTIKS